MSPRYTHTTIEYVEPRVWGHPRDYHDWLDGREDVGPLDDPLTNALTRSIARKGELLCMRVHLEEIVDLPVEAISVEISVEH